VNVTHCIEEVARRFPSRPALIVDESGEQVSFRQFADAIAATGALICKNAKLSEGGRVALLGDGSAHYLYAEYGAMNAGLVRVSLDPSLTSEELAAQISDAGAGVLLFASAHAQRAEEVQRLIGGTRLALALLDDLGNLTAPQEVPQSDDGKGIAALNYTGGTTGKPKAVIHTHASLNAAKENVVQAWIADGSDAARLMLNVRPLWPIAAIGLLAHLSQGGTVILGGHFSSETFADQVARHGAQCTSLVPTHLVRLTRELKPGDERLASLQRIDIGAAALSFDVLSQAKEIFGNTLAMLYGLTEAPWSCYRNRAALSLVTRDDLLTHGLVGVPTRNSRISILSPDGLPCATGESGEVVIEGGHLMACYWNRPQATSDVLFGGRFHTGDVGQLDEAGRLYLTGRAKEIIRSGGKSVQPGEVEAVLCEHPAVADAAVVGIADVEWGEMVAAAVVAKLGATLSAEILTEYCRQRLSAHKRPRRILIVESVPRSHYGKIQRAKVKQQFDQV